MFREVIAKLFFSDPRPRNANVFRWKTKHFLPRMTHHMYDTPCHLWKEILCFLQRNIRIACPKTWQIDSNFAIISRRYFVLLIFLLGSALHAQKFPDSQSTQQVWKDFCDLKAEEADLFLEKRHLTEEIAHFQKTIQELSQMKSEKEYSLVKKKKDLEKKLPLLVRLSRVNPLRLLVDTAIGKETLRGIILTRSFSTSLKQQLNDIQTDLHAISSLSQELKEKKESYTQLIEGLNVQQMHLASLQKQLIKYIEKSELERLKGEEDVNVLLNESRATLSKKGQQVQAASTEENLPFRWLERPATGKILHDPELQEKFSSNGQGIIFETKKNADVLSPSEGTIAFKGPFKSQGDILIIDHGQNVHTVLMGMHKIDAEVGQNVYAGQKLGIMAGYGATLPKLYLELRKDGKPIDPYPYFIE